jgi:hypothetical protein
MKPGMVILKENLWGRLPSSLKTGAKRLSVRLRRIKRSVTAFASRDNRLGFIVGFSIITMIALIIFRNFILINKWPAGGDVLGLISRVYLYGQDSRWLYVWRMYSFGFPESVNSLDAILLVIFSIFRDPSSTTKAFLFLSFLIAGFSMYFFAYRYTRKHLAAFAGSLVYVLNQWFFSQFTEAHGDIVFSFALAPLLFLVLDKALISGKAKSSLAFAVLLAVFFTGFHPECIVIYGFALLIFVAFFLFVPSKQNSLRIRAKHLLKVCVVAGIVTSLLCAFALASFFSNASAPYYSANYRYYIEEAEGGSYQRISDAFTLTGVEKWGYGLVLSGPEDINLPDFPVTAVLSVLFLLAYCTILFKRDRYTYFFAFSAAVSLVMSLGPHSWFGQVFVWAWFYVPHFAVFRATSRWIMLAVFSHAFFISILVSMVTTHLRKKKPLQNASMSLEEYQKIKPQRFRALLTTLLDFYKGLYQMFYYAAVLLLVLILFLGFFSCFYFFSTGLQVYSPPNSYLEPFEWMADKPGDFKMVTVMRSAGEWWGTPGAESDFGYAGMLTDLGWGHDIGGDSSFIHGKPVLQDGGWDPFSRSFVDYLRFDLGRKNATNDITKMLGAFDYKYIIIPAYVNGSIRDFFLNQEGGHVIYDQDGSLVIENSFYTPHIFATTDHVVVVGGLQTFSSLCKIKDFQLNQTALLFAQQINSSPLLASALLNSSQSLVFVDSDMLDFLMLSLEGNSIMINPVECGLPSMDHDKYWVQDQYWRTAGYLVLSRETLTTFGQNSIDIPFKADHDGAYDLWIRLAFAPNRGRLRLFVDQKFCGDILPECESISGLRWSNISRVDLKGGNHVLTLANGGSGFNDVDAISFVEPSVFEKGLNDLNTYMKTFGGRVVFVNEAEHLEFSGWRAVTWPLNDNVLHSEGRGRIISYEGHASASSVEMEGLGAEKAIDGSLNSRWSSQRGSPQWLEVDWDNPRTVTGVHIIFEQALAKDYTIQTWNGDSWVSQVNVTGNKLLEQFHDFPQEVNTTKVRIYITGMSDFGNTSIWEFEIYSPIGDITAKAKIFVPTSGKYMIAARLAVGKDYGTLYVKAGATEYAISCEDLKNDLEWREVGPLSLDAGPQEVEFRPVGKMDLDTIVVYSLRSDEDSLSINDLFEGKAIPPNVTYDKVDPCRYVVHVDSNESFLLFFSESYHPSWEARIDGVEATHFIGYYIVNGYSVEKTGKFDIILNFAPQDSVDLTLKVSLATLVCLLIVGVIWSKPLDPLRRFARERLSKKKFDKNVVLGQLRNQRILRGRNSWFKKSEKR